MVAALPAASLNPVMAGRGPRPRSGAMANCPNAGQGSPSAISTNGRPLHLTGSPSSGAPHGPGHKLAAGNGQRTSRNLIHGDRLLPARYEVLVHLERPQHTGPIRAGPASGGGAAGTGAHATEAAVRPWRGGVR